MNYKVLGVKVFPAKNCGSVLLATCPNVATEKYRTYGVIPLEKFSRDMVVIESAVNYIGKYCDILVDINGSIASITPADEGGEN